MAAIYGLIRARWRRSGEKHACRFVVVKRGQLVARATVEAAGNGGAGNMAGASGSIATTGMARASLTEEGRFTISVVFSGCRAAPPPVLYIVHHKYSRLSPCGIGRRAVFIIYPIEWYVVKRLHHMAILPSSRATPCAYLYEEHICNLDLHSFDL